MWRVVCRQSCCDKAVWCGVVRGAVSTVVCSAWCGVLYGGMGGSQCGVLFGGSSVAWHNVVS
jgi:hypothetical protein